MKSSRQQNQSLESTASLALKSDTEDRGPQQTSPLPQRTQSKKVFFAWVLVIFWAGFIFFMSSNTSSGLSGDLGFFSQVYQQLKIVQENIFGPGIDIMSSLAHFAEYLVFSVLIANALRNHMPLRQACVLAIACASLYGISDEFHQFFVPERMCDPLDWLVDTLGSAVGVGLTWLMLKKRYSSPNCMR